MGLIKPEVPAFEIDEWRAEPPAERLRMMCVTWATQGFGAPDVVYVLYIFKIAFYIGGFMFFAALTEGLGGPASFGDWWSEPLAFQKAVLWTILFEVMGLGCGSGPLTGHYKPLFPTVRHWLRPGTIRLRPFTWVPGTAGHRRTLLDVGLYAAVLALLLWALLADTLDRWDVAPIIAAICLLGLRDKAIFLAARSEHYVLTAFVFLFPEDVLAGAVAIQLVLWIGAAVSKFTHHFTPVMAIMQSNSPVYRSKAARRKLWRNYPDDLRPSTLATGMAHGATIIEFGFPLALAFATDGPVRTAAIVLMVLFHIGILTSIPMGVPLEWNVFFIYSGLVLFSAHSDVRFWHIESPILILALVAFIALGPVLGNLRPDKVSFLPSLRYYAGNWAPTLWLFRGEAMAKLDDSIIKAAPIHRLQLEGQIEPGTYDVTMSRGQAMRAMHLHGRALATLSPRMVEDLAATDPEVAAKGTDAFDSIDGEMIAGLVLGWNFGCGHLHHEQLLEAIQTECNFAPGELRCLFLESQPLHQQRMHWRIADAADGQLHEGHIEISDLMPLQPWGAPSPT